MLHNHKICEIYFHITEFPQNKLAMAKKAITLNLKIDKDLDKSTGTADFNSLCRSYDTVLASEMFVIQHTFIT